MSGKDNEKLTDAALKAIRILVQKGYSADQVARMTGLSKSQVWRTIALIPSKGKTAS